MKLKSITLASLLMLGDIVYASNAGTDTVCLGEVCQLDEIEVLTTRVKVASEHLRVISVISSEQIKAIPATNINELLENLPGVDVRTRGVAGVQADISMRGSTFDQVVVLLNGINITDPQTGHYSLDLPIDLQMIERIEVLQGTTMNIFGLSAFAGAINIVTGSTTSDKTTASIAGGDHGLINAALGANYGVEDWRLSASLSYNRSDGYMPNSDFEFGNMMLQAAGSDSVAGNWNIQFGGQIKNYGANVFYSLAYPNQYEQTRTLLGSVAWDKRIGNFGIEASVYNRTHFDHYELIRGFENAPQWYTFHNNHLTLVTGANIKGAWFSGIGKTAVGIEARNEQILSNVLGDELDKPVRVPGQDNTTYYLKGKNRLNVNYFVEQSFYVGRFSGAVGFSGNWNTMFDHNFAFGVNVGYQFLPGANLFASANRSLRLPSFTDLYYESKIQISNPNLKPEIGYTAELGVNYSGCGFNAHMSAYYRVGQNIIDWIKLPDEQVWHSMNHSRVDAMGGEVAVSYSYGRWLPKAEVSYSFCHLNKDAGKYLSKYALDYLRHKLVLEVEHGIYGGFGASWQLSFRQRNGQYADTNGDLVNYKPIWLLDGKLFWQGEKIRLYVEASNMTNSKYYDYGGILQPGIWAKGGIVVKI